MKSAYNLLKIGPLRSTLVSRWPLLIVRLMTLGGFVLAIIAGLFGTPVGNHNIAIVGVWIAWWAVLMLILVPMLGRGWCSVCPIPLPGEWLANGAVLGPAGRGLLKSKRRFPKAFRNIWLQNGAFTLLSLFSPILLTRPSITAWVLLGMILVAVGMALFYERRSFCRHVCPVGGFIGLYSQLSPLELRVIDPYVCKSHADKSCYQGNANGFGCPWGVFPGALQTNVNCGLCMECLRTCEYENIALNLRAFGTDIRAPHRSGIDEAYKGFIMLGSALVYSVVLVGPWGDLKSLAASIGSLAWGGYGLALIALTWGLIPALFYMFHWLGLRSSSSPYPPGRVVIQFAPALLPLGLMAWVAFSISFVFANFSYLWPVLSDPFGWGWDLFNTAALGWTPYGGNLMPGLQTMALLLGLLWCGVLAKRIARTSGSKYPVWPTTLFSFLITVAFLGVLVA